MRTRSRSSQEIIGCDLLQTQSYAGATNVIFKDASSVLLNSSKTMTDTVNPGYFKAEREGILKPVSPMSSTELTWVCANAAWSGYRDNGWGFLYRYTGNGLPAGSTSLARQLADLCPVPSPPAKEVMMQEALARAQTDAWDTLTFLAEFEKTIASLVSLRSRVDGHINKCFRRASSRLHLFASLADAFADAWLEYRYSFRPLYYDMLDIQKSIDRFNAGISSPLCRGWETRESSPGSLTASSTVPGFYLDTGLAPSTSIIGMDDGYIYRTISGSCSRSVRGRATVGVQATTRVLTQVDFAVTAWELIPFSFVLDWFISIGSAISAFSPFATGAFRYGTWSLFDVSTSQVDSSFLGVGGVVQTSSSPSSVSLIIETKSRELSSVTPTLAVDVNLDISKVIDLVALWTSRNSGILRRINQRR